MHRPCSDSKPAAAWEAQAAPSALEEPDHLALPWTIVVGTAVAVLVAVLAAVPAAVPAAVHHPAACFACSASVVAATESPYLAPLDALRTIDSAHHSTFRGSSGARPPDSERYVASTFPNQICGLAQTGTESGGQVSEMAVDPLRVASFDSVGAAAVPAAGALMSHFEVAVVAAAGSEVAVN